MVAVNVEYHYAALSLCVFGILAVPICQYLWSKWRAYKPLNGRPYFFVVYYNVVVVLCLLSLAFFELFLLFDEGAYFRSLRYIEISEWVIIPLYFHCYMWRAWHLFFVFNLTEYRMNTQNIDKKNWFQDHSQWVTRTNLRRSFLIFNTISLLILLCTGIGMSFWSGGQIIFSIFVSLYILGLLLLAFLIRHVRDDYVLKMEIIGVGFWWLAMLILIGVSTSFVDHSIYGVLALAFVGSYLITIVMPLYKARLYVTLEQHPSTTSDDDSLTIDSYNTGTTKADYKSLEGVMAEPKLLESFSMFVAKHFKVEMIYFLIQLESFKRMEDAVLAGKALLMYQKFIKEKSFLHLDLPQELIAEIEDVVLNEEKLLESQCITKNFFSKIEELCTTELNVLLKEWRKSEDYEKIVNKLNGKNLLNVGLQSSTTEEAV